MRLYEFWVYIDIFTGTTTGRIVWLVSWLDLIDCSHWTVIPIVIWGTCWYINYVVSYLGTPKVFNNSNFLWYWYPPVLITDWIWKRLLWWIRRHIYTHKYCCYCCTTLTRWIVWGMCTIAWSSRGRQYKPKEERRQGYMGVQE